MNPEERLLQVLDATHGQIVRFALDGYQRHGRGVTRIDLPAMKAEGDAQMVYQDVAEVKQATVDLTGSAAADAGVLIRMIETYDPARQVVIHVDVEGQKTFSAKMRIERAVGPAGVH